MKITAINQNDPFQQVIFTWNEELTECKFVELGIEDETILQTLIDNKVHEGSDFGEWITKID